MWYIGDVQVQYSSTLGLSNRVVTRVSEPACFGTAPAPGIFNPESAAAPAPGKREQKFGFFLN